MGLVTESYAEFLTARAHVLTHIPQGLDVLQAGAYPLVATTGDQLAGHLALKRGDKALVTGALGGVGRTAVYVAKQRGAHVIAGVRAKQKSAAESLGVDRVVAIDDEREIASLPPGLDSVADTVDGEAIAKLIPKLKPGGVLGSVLGIPQAAEGKNVRVEAFMAHPDASRLHQLASDLRDKRFTIPISRTFRFAEAADAHQLAESGDTHGKILLVP